MQRIAFAKGHGTENDFLIIPDQDGTLELSDADVSAICHRRSGLGADGILRVVPAAYLANGDAGSGLWFMDYRNADGSVAQMCGNGIRVFAQYLIERGWAAGPSIDIATRDGNKTVSVTADGRLRVNMGPVRVGDDAVTIRTHDSAVALSGHPADVGNPHAVAFVDDVGSWSLDSPPTWSPIDRFPDGVNIEFVQTIAPCHLAVRVYERGSRETRSCGTGVCAAVAVAARNADDDLPTTYRVDVPGGTLTVELTETDAYLIGPAAIVASGVFTVPPIGSP